VSDLHEAFLWAVNHGLVLDSVCRCGYSISSAEEVCPECKAEAEADRGDSISKGEREEALCR
jgi:uncharacterized OB-fold protein